MDRGDLAGLHRSALFEILLVITNIGTSVMLFPMLHDVLPAVSPAAYGA